MQIARLIRTSSFRLTLVYLLVFGVSVAVPFAFLYSATVGSIDSQTNAAILAELNGLLDAYEHMGSTGMPALVADRSTDPGDRDAVYLLVDAKNKPLAGNIADWPTATRQEGSWLRFTIEKTEGGDVVPHTVRARAVRLTDGEGLLVGRDIHDRAEVQRQITEALGWTLAITLALGMTGGALMSRYMLRRVDEVAQTSRKIMEGSLSQRIPIGGTGDEFDRLAANLNAMLDQIEQLMTSMRTVTDSVAHDLRGPLTHLKGRIELALRGEANLAAYRNALETAVTATDGILSVFNALIEVAKAESGLGRSDLVPLDLGALATDVIELYEPLAEDRGLTVTTAIANDATILGNPHLLAQAIANLLDNAIKYGASGGQIALAVESKPDRVRLEVSDKGPGIAAADRMRALDRFERVGADPKIPGSGLGLSLVAAVARLHRATLELGDNDPGLRVSIDFPRHARPMTAAGSASGPVRGQTN
ncbi:MAG: HAMP domain-containing sensor histidine kinase [Alphaproteobacteria bacterium]